jgi:enoyl-CoA hydratase
MLLTARAYTADEAQQIGLIGHVVPDGQALSKAHELADLICANGPLAVEAILKSVQETAGLDETEGLKREFEIGWPIFSTNDSKEGPRAFAEKRPPEWTRT